VIDLYSFANSSATATGPVFRIQLGWHKSISETVNIKLSIPLRLCGVGRGIRDMALPRVNVRWSHSSLKPILIFDTGTY
jgi:hypothetical protein